MAQIDPRKRTASGVVGGTTTGQALGGASPAAQPSTGGSAPAGGATAAGPPQASQRPAQAGTGFVNLSQVLSANRPAAQQMGAGLVNSATQKASQAQTQAASAKNTFEAAGRAAVGAYNPNAAGAASADIRAKQQANDQSYFYGNPNATLSDGRQDTRLANLGYERLSQAAQKELDILNPLTGVEYKGPKTWEDAGIDVAGIAARTAAAQDETAALGTAGGRQALLSKSVTGPYSAGNRALDSAFLTSAIGQQGQQVAAQYANLSDMLAKSRGEAAGAYDTNVATQGAVNDKYKADVGKYERDKQIADAGFEATKRDNLASHTRMDRPLTPGAIGTIGSPSGKNPYTGESYARDPNIPWDSGRDEWGKGEGPTKTVGAGGFADAVFEGVPGLNTIFGRRRP